ncbi:putative Tip elongation aberrant protein 1 [Blattamonas nauphoetae]|uniref:Tip elongation aberrant protein 1 n=1 Tax=Blattamonas nauphoetae TaxID=2049346 RepID=A0ABQ9YF58_9EUKA|nr:putative Tip elongation aberrant protein 1 [Blattamonas nauphoetae]
MHFAAPAAKSFTLLQAEGVLPPGMSDSSICVYNSELYAFGGDLGQDFSNEIFKYSFESNVWTRLPVVGCIPAARSSHTSVIYGDEMIIYGGGGVLGLVFDDIYAFSFETHTWRVVQLAGPGTPKARRNHAAVLSGSRMYVFGGSDGETRMQDTWCFDFETDKWSEIKVVGTKPPPREMHTAAKYQKYMYIFGGLGDEIFSDLWEFEFATGQWTEIRPMKAPNPRYRHSAVINGGSMYVFGGQDTMTRLNDVQIQHRSIMYQGTMYCFGGHDGMSCLNDLGRYNFTAPSSLRTDLAAAFSSSTDCQIYSTTRPYPISRALVKARFPPLLPYLSPKTEFTAESFAPINPLPLSDRAIESLLQYINTDTLPISELDIQEIISLLSFGEECGSVKIKIQCAGALSHIDLTSLTNLAEVMVAAKKFGLVQLERTVVHHFVALLPFSLAILVHFPEDALKHYSILIGRLISQDSSIELRDQSIANIFGKDRQKLANFVEETMALAGLQ